MAITLDLYSHVLPHMQAGTAQKIEELLGEAGRDEGAGEVPAG